MLSVIDNLSFDRHFPKVSIESDNKSISSLDTSGVALAAIKALKQENDEFKMKDNELAQLLKEKDAQIAQLQHQIDELKEMQTSIVVLNQSEKMAGQL